MRTDRLPPPPPPPPERPSLSNLGLSDEGSPEVAREALDEAKAKEQAGDLRAAFLLGQDLLIDFHGEISEDLLVEAYAFMGRVSLHQGKRERAAKYLQKVKALRPADPEMQKLMAELATVPAQAAGTSQPPAPKIEASEAAATKPKSPLPPPLPRGPKPSSLPPPASVASGTAVPEQSERVVARESSPLAEALKVALIAEEPSLEAESVAFEALEKTEEVPLAPPVPEALEKTEEVPVAPSAPEALEKTEEVPLAPSLPEAVGKAAAAPAPPSASEAVPGQAMAALEEAAAPRVEPPAKDLVEVLPLVAQEGRLAWAAGFWLRVLAFAIDGVLVTGVVLVMLVLASILLRQGATGLFKNFFERAANPAAVAGIFFLSLVVYHTLFARYGGQTVGKMLLCLRVVGLTGHSLTTAQALRRLFGMVIAALPGLAGFLWAGFDLRRRGWHDWIGGTLVVRLHPPRSVQ